MTAYWTTQGVARGTCGHKHKTMLAAAECAQKDRESCKSGGRRVMRVENGTTRHLTDQERGLLKNQF